MNWLSRTANRRLTVAGALGALVCLLGIPIAFLAPEMALAGEVDIALSPPSNDTLGLALVIAAPFLGVLAGWVSLRGRRGWKWQLAAILIGATVAAGLLVFGARLM